MLASWFVDSVLDRTKNWKNFLLLANKNRMSVCVGGGGVLQVLTHLPPSASWTRVYMCVWVCDRPFTYVRFELKNTKNTSTEHKFVSCLSSCQ